MPKDDNKVPGKLTDEQAAELIRKSAAVSGAASRYKKELGESLSVLLEMDVTDDEAKDELKAAGFNDDNMMNLSYLGYALYKKALDGDVEAFREIRKLTDEAEKTLLQTENLRALLLERALKAEAKIKEYAEGMNMHSCDECKKLSDFKQKAKELKDALEHGDENKLRNAAKKIVESVEM